MLRSVILSSAASIAALERTIDSILSPCVPVCPLEAIEHETDPGAERWLAINASYAKQWPNIMAKKKTPPDAKEWEDVPDKLAKYFSPYPGKGD
jgi:ferredoxin